MNLGWSSHACNAANVEMIAESLLCGGIFMMQLWRTEYIVLVSIGTNYAGLLVMCTSTILRATSWWDKVDTLLLPILSTIRYF